MDHIGKRIKELRKKNDLTQERLADLLGVTDKAVSKWECGLTAPDLALIIPLTRILHVSADELLGGKIEEIDAQRVEFNEHCDNYLKYDMKDNYQIAQKAVSEHHYEYKEDSTAKYSVELLERAIKHNNIVIAECDDSGIRQKSIWNAMMCFRDMEKYDEAIKYAEMFPVEGVLTRDRAMERCLQGEKLTEHRQWMIYKNLRGFLISLSRIYWFSEKKDALVIAALDTEETILQTLFPEGNYFEFHGNLCCAYQRRAEFEIVEGNYERAVEYLRTMLEHAKKIPCGESIFLHGVFSGLSVKNSEENTLLPYVISGLDDVNKSILEQLQNRIKTLNIYAPLWKREDFQKLF